MPEAPDERDGFSPDYFGPEKVMVVDDEPAVRRFLARAIEGRGYSAEAFGSACEALEHLESGEFAVVLADIGMPEHDGLWLLDRIMAMESDLTVVMVTANNESRTAIDCLTRGASNYIIKPVNPDELSQVVARAMEGRRLRIENKAYRADLERLVGQRTAELNETLHALEKANVMIESAYRESIYRLAAAAEYRDEETGNHIRRIGLYSRLIAQRLECTEEMLTLILLASPMHDVGKIGIRDSILLKPGRLTPSEFEEIKAHTVIGGRILAGSTSPLLQMAEVIAMTHHERWDGAGYPSGLIGEQIPLPGRVVALADVFDALTTNRVYRSAYGVDDALTVMKADVGHFDARVVTAFFDALDDIRVVRRSYGDSVAEPGVKDASLASEVILSIASLETAARAIG
jgi:putative two-component system response regulator